MTASQSRPGSWLRAALNAGWRTVRTATRVLRDLHAEQIRAYEILLQANRALPERATGPLTWVRTLDGYQLAGSHLPDPGRRA